MNEEIKRIFQDFTVGNKQIDVAHLRYTGKAKTYVIWTVLGEIPSFSYDDEVQYTKATVDIDIYSIGNYLNIIKKIKEIMKNNEWDWVEDSEEMYEEDTKLYHKTITFEKERKKEWLEED